jgi:anti-sigma-K factor RskA
MSGPVNDDLAPSELAGAYVLGTLEGTARAAAEARVAHDPAFAAEVAEWQRRLAPLAELAPPVDPPAELWARIAAATAPPAPPRRAGFGVRFWQASTLGALSLAAALAAIMLLRPPEPAALAVLEGRGGVPEFVAVARGGRLALRPLGGVAPAPAGHEMELWVLDTGARAPRPLGALPSTGRAGPAGPDVTTGAELLVSLEPAGGAPHGVPTGPVLFRGRLAPL